MNRDRVVRCKVCGVKTRNWRPVFVVRKRREFREKHCGRCIDARHVVRKAAMRRDFVVIGAFRRILRRLFPGLKKAA